MNIPVIAITSTQLAMLLRELNANPITTLYVWIDDDGAKFKIDRSTWSPPLGHVEER